MKQRLPEEETYSSPSVVTFRRVWSGLPDFIRRSLHRTGIPYLIRFFLDYRTDVCADRFAGNLPSLHQEWKDASTEHEREVAVQKIEEIQNSLVLSNGVRKTTFAGRQHQMLTRFLSGSDRHRDGSAVRVLDLPCSNGTSSLGAYNLLRDHYRVESYVLADICLEVRYDEEQGIVYDSSGRALQVLGSERFCSIYLPYASGDNFSWLVSLVLLPFRLRAKHLRRKLDRACVTDLKLIRLVHPELDSMVQGDPFELRQADVFALDWVEEFDLVVSFNLLQKNYFPAATIDLGIQNLTHAIRDGGYLLTGNSEELIVFRKRNGRLVPLNRSAGEGM